MPVGVVADPGVTILNTLKTYSGISLTPAIGRLETPESGMVGNTLYRECCSYLYTTTAYDGISGPEQLFNAKLKGQNGGSLVIMDKTGKIIRSLIDSKKRNGEDVLL